MSEVICQGCGQAFDVPEGYARNKIQCPGCGVICPVPAGGGGGAPARPARSRPARDEAGRERERPERERQRPEAPAGGLLSPPPAPPPDPWGQQEAVPVAQEVPALRQEAERGDPVPVKRAAPEV